MEYECFPCEHNITASFTCTPLLMNRLIQRWHKYKRGSDKENILILTKLSSYIEDYVKTYCGDIDTGTTMTYSKLIATKQNDAIFLLSRNYLHHKKKSFGTSLISCSYCEKYFCEYHCMYTEFTHFKCTDCGVLKSVCENCVQKSDRMKICYDCSYANSLMYIQNSVILDYSDVNKRIDEEIECDNDINKTHDDLWQEILDDLDLTDVDMVDDTVNTDAPFCIMTGMKDVQI